MHIDILSLSLRELDAVALATNATVSMKRDTRQPTERNTVRTSDLGDAVENLCLIRARDEEGRILWLQSGAPLIERNGSQGSKILLDSGVDGLRRSFLSLLFF